jgi:hypothetical protein
LKMHTRDNNQHDRDEALEAPPQLVSALRRLPGKPVFIPPTADEAVLRAARRHLTQPRELWVGWFRRIWRGPGGRAEKDDLLSLALSSKGGEGNGAAAGGRRDAPGWFRFLPWVAGAAAALLLLAAIPQFFKRPAPGPGRDAAFARGDLNRDGHVDILDAFALARQLKLGGTRNLQLDVNGDGVVDERDVAALAARAVKLEQGGRS